MGTDAAEEVEIVRKPCSFKVHRLMCTEIWKLVERISKIFPDIEAARPHCSTGIEALCQLSRAIDRAKQLVQYCSESSKLYLAFTGDVLVSRFQKSRNLLEQSLCQIQNWVPVILVAEISKVVLDVKAATFRFDPSEDEAGKVIRELIHLGASASDTTEDSELKALKLVSVRLHITTAKEVLIEKRSIKKLLQKVGDSDDKKKQILTYFFYLFRKYGNLILVNKTENAIVWEHGSLALENSGKDWGYNQCAETKPHTGYREYEAESNMSPPEELLCGISSRLMYDPVVIASGQTYERMWIQKWIHEGNDTCPKTNTKLAHLSLIPNVAIRESTSKWCTKYGVTIPDPMQPEALSSWENSATSIASLGSSMNDLRLQMDLSAMSFGFSDTSFNSKAKDSSDLVQIDGDSLKYRYAKQHDTDLEFLSKISELNWDSQLKAIKDVQNRLDSNPQVSYTMSSKNFVKPLIKFLTEAYNQDDVEAQRDGYKLLSTFLRKNRKGISDLCEDAYSLLVSSLDSKVKEEGLSIMAILSVHQDCRGNIASSGALTALIKLLHSTISSIQGNALKVWHNLSFDRDICSKMVSMECIPQLVPLFRDSALSGNFISILKNLCDSGRAIISVAETDGCIASVAEVLEYGSKEHQEHAVDILLCLCSQRVEYCRLVMHEGVIPALVHSSANGTERAKINAMEVLRLLRDIDYVSEQESTEHESPPEPEPEAPRDELPRDIVYQSNGKKASKASGFFGKKISMFSKPSSLSSKKK